jgi:hypothetical protein
MVAWYVLSNESYMKRVIKEVLPTVHEWNSNQKINFTQLTHKIDDKSLTALFTKKHKLKLFKWIAEVAGRRHFDVKLCSLSKSK